MNDLTLASTGDAPEIHRLLQACAQEMIRNDVDQWNDSYPTIDRVEEDLSKQELFKVCIDNTIAAVITLNSFESPEYKKLTWTENSTPTMVVHRLAVHPDFQKRGLASRLMGFAEDWAIDKQYKSIRLDTYSQNRINVDFYEKREYKYVGQVFFSRLSSPFNCYEKILP